MSDAEPTPQHDSDPALPDDPDIQAAARGHGGLLPAHLTWASVGLVAVGGTLGTGLRDLVGTLLPPRGGVPVGIFVVNVSGALLLGVLLEVLAEHGNDVGWSRWLRFGVGTGVMGGYTTYSALATDTVLLAGEHPARAAAYGLGTLLVGVVATYAGIALSRSRLRPALHRRLGRP